MKLIMYKRWLSLLKESLVSFHIYQSNSTSTITADRYNVTVLSLQGSD